MARARQTLFERRRRIQVFGAGMFAETGWDVLLALYSQRFGARLTISNLTDLTGAAPTTVLRWIVFLEERNLIQRKSSPLDRRVALLELTERAQRLLDIYFSETL
jgi:DNA-binding MarR family transcriptional regulator